MNAGHLKAIHRSLFYRYGPLDPVYNACQDYEFLLRVLKNEIVAVIPEYLYMYRWHDKTQSITRFVAQEQAAAAAKYKHNVNPKGTRPMGLTAHKVGMIIRTQGERNDSLAEAIGSCTTAEPDVQLVPIVTVHGAAKRADHVAQALERRGIRRQEYQLVQASAQDRYRGYPLNQGAKHALEVLGCSAIGIVDDDDIILPAFAQMVKSLRADRPAIVSARTLAADLDGRREEMHLPLPAASLVFENFIPTNGFVANRAALIAVISKHGQLFPEDLHYLEDWHFFVAALDAGTEFRVFDEVVAEFRLGSDGNADQRKHPFEFERCRVRVQQFAERVKRAHGAKLLQQQGPIAQRFLSKLGVRQRKNLLSLVSTEEKS
jgi:hypothetical protein